MPDIDVLTSLLTRPIVKDVLTRVLSDGRVRFGELRESFETATKEDIRTAIKALENAKLIDQAGGTNLSDFTVIYPTSEGLRVGRQLNLDGPSIVRGFKKL